MSSYLETAFHKLRQAEEASGRADDRGDWSSADEARRLQTEAVVYALAAISVELPSGFQG